MVGLGRCGGLVVALLLALGAVLPLPVPGASAQSMGPEDVVRQFTAAAERGDLEAMLGHLHDRVVFLTASTGNCHTAPCIGKAAVRPALEEWAAPPGGSARHLDIRALGGTNTVINRIEMRAPRVQATGVERVILARTFVVHQGKIVALHGGLDLSDPQTATFASRLGGPVRPAGAGTGPGAEEVVREHLGHASRNDVEAQLAQLHDDAVFATVSDGACSAQPCRGKAAIRSALEQWRALGANSSYRLLQAEGNTVVVRVEWRGADTRAAGVERAVGVRTFIVRDGRILLNYSVPDLSDPQMVRYMAYYSGRSAAVPSGQLGPVAQLPRTGEADLPLPALAGLGLLLAAAGLRLGRPR